jgi:hypothetical protein
VERTICARLSAHRLDIDACFNVSGATEHQSRPLLQFDVECMLRVLANRTHMQRRASLRAIATASQRRRQTMPLHPVEVSAVQNRLIVSADLVKVMG